MICPACGAENREGARFCRQCRFELAAAAPVKAPPAEKPAAAEPLEAERVVQGRREPFGEEVPDETPAVEAGVPAATSEHKESTEEAEGLVEEPAEEPTPEAEGSAAALQPTSEVIESTEEAEGPVEEAEGEPGDQEPDAGTTPDRPGGGAEAGEPAGPPEPQEDVLLFYREEPEPLQPLEPGSVVAGRYRVVEVLDAQPAQVLYETEDLGACWQCGFEGNSPDDAFCAQCGAALERRPQIRLLQIAQGESGPALPAEADLGHPLQHEGQVFFRVSEPPAASEPLEQDLRLVVGHRSDTGRVRELDEDSLLAVSLAPNYQARTAPILGLFAVADGMGGHEGGEIASKLALQVLAERVMKDIMLSELAGEPSPEDVLLARLHNGVVAANDAVYLARQKRANDMGTTLTAALVRDARLFVAHVGDSRAYRWNAQGLEQLTTDHSVVASMIANGQAAPEEIYSHPHRSIIYRSIGDKPSVDVDAEVLPLAAGDRLIICSDGLWEMVRNEGIADVMLQEADPQAACDLLVKHANLAGGEDNISVVVVAVVAT